MKSCELQRRPIVTEAGRRVGHVDEIHTEDGVVTAFVCGRGGLLQRFARARGGRRIPWDRVVRITQDAVVVADD